MKYKNVYQKTTAEFAFQLTYDKLILHIFNTIFA